MSLTGARREALARLRKLLTPRDERRVSENVKSEVLGLLGDEWHRLRKICPGDSGPPTGLEALCWDPPVLSFCTRDRGPYRDELRGWTIDVERGEYAVSMPEPRVLREHIDRIADELAQIIADRGTDDRLQWSKAGKVRVRINKVLPPATNRTMHDRRRRLYGALSRRLAPEGRLRPVGGWWDLVNTAKIADELAEIIVEGRTDDRLQWFEDRRVRVRTEKVLPPAPNRAMQERLQKLYRHMHERLAPLGWLWPEEGWWEPANTEPIADELAKLIADERTDDRLEWSGKGEVRVLINSILPPAVSRTTRERHERLYRDLRARLAPLGWEVGDPGWFELWYADLRVCCTCGKLTGEVHPRGCGYRVHQKCDCSRTASPRWSGFDFNLAAELCRCCGQVLLESGSRYSVWFCRGCREQVILLNRRLGRYVVPIGRHSVHGGFLLRGDAGPVDTLIFADRWTHISDVMRHLDEWSAVVVRRILAERWGAPPKSIPLIDYLERCVDDEEEKMRRFREMMEFLQGRAGSS